LEFTTAQKKEVTVYLSPDRSYLATDLLDLRVDPLLEERQHLAETMSAMLAGDPPVLGNQNAQTKVVVFSDFECPYCRKLKDVLEQQILPRETDKVAIAFRNFPLPMHPWAKPAAMLAMCADLQRDSEFWKVHDFIFEHQKELNTDNLDHVVREFVRSHTSLNVFEFEKCVDKDLALGLVSKDVALGEANGVRATPALFVNGVRYDGVPNAEQLLAIIGDSRHVTPSAGQLASKSNSDDDGQCTKASNPQPRESKATNRMADSVNTQRQRPMAAVVPPSAQ
jgi:protein-disulfide isomerase